MLPGVIYLGIVVQIAIWVVGICNVLAKFHLSTWKTEYIQTKISISILTFKDLASLYENPTLRINIDHCIPPTVRPHIYFIRFYWKSIIHMTIII